MLNTIDSSVIYALDPAQLQINDVVLTSQRGGFSALIRAVTRPNFSHAAIVVSSWRSHLESGVEAVNIVSTKQTSGHYGNEESGASQAWQRVQG